jgi:hypothetical protein
VLTLTQNPAELDPRALRYAALLAISTGAGLAWLRTRAAGTPQEITDKQIADEAGYLAARGVTMRVARRVSRERDRANPAYRDRRYTLQDARQVARIYLGAGMTSAALREDTALRGTPEERRRFAMIADAMDALLAEGFDAVAYGRELLASGGAR